MKMRFWRKLNGKNNIELPAVVKKVYHPLFVREYPSNKFHKSLRYALVSQENWSRLLNVMRICESLNLQIHHYLSTISSLNFRPKKILLNLISLIIQPENIMQLLL